MGGKTSTSTSQVAVPPQVLAQYQAVNSQASRTAQTPFQQYGGEFVAPVNTEQSAGIAGTNTAATQAQPYYSAATGVLAGTQAGTAPINAAAESGTAASAAPLTGAQIDQYLSPYLGTVLNSTEAIQSQENQQQQAGQLGDAIRSGAFGSDRTGVAAANLEQQQNLANANIISGIANQGYQSALGTAQGQQQIGLAGAQQEANIGQTAYGEGANTSSELAALGTGAQSAGLAGAQAQIGAGTVQQQTQQAEDTAQYNQFLQQQSYPFQVDQFLANIAEGTGSLSGSTTTTTQPGGFFSDKRLKHDIKKIGETYDGQSVYSYKMHGDPRTHIGLIAQQVEKKHPEAVGLAGGYKTVDYGKATQEAANAGHFYRGGVVPFRRIHRDTGGGLAGVLQAQQQMYGQMPGNRQREIATGTDGGSHQLAVASAPASPPPSGASEVGQTMSLADKGYHLYKDFSAPSAAAPAATTLPAGVSPAVGAGPTAAELGTTEGALSAAPAATAPAAGGGLAGAAGAGTAGAGAAGAGVAGAGAGAAGAAGAGAAGAAAGTAAGAAAGAGAAAAGTAAAGAGTAAAADAAAAIAAEYAAADIGVAAAMAAKRGGAIRRRYGAGGMPYSGVAGPYEDTGGSMNIPDVQDTHSLNAAPAAGKQPTGLQTMMYMGDPNNTSQLTGELFSNTAMATGGVAGKRRGFDGGGGATDDTSDSTSSPDDATSAAPPAAPSGGGLAGWWDRNKGIAIPVLEGVGAAMTAPTSHPGVAIAAGLEAAAKGYVPTQEGLARAQERQALARAVELENIPRSVKARIAQSVPIPGTTAQQPQGGVAPPPQPLTVPNPAPATIAAEQPATRSVPPGGAPTAAATALATTDPKGSAPFSPTNAAATAAQIDNYYRNEIPTADGGHGYWVNPTGSPAQMAAIQAAREQDWAVGGGTTFQQNAILGRDRAVQSAQATNLKDAQQRWQQFYSQYTAPGATPAVKANALLNMQALEQWSGDKPTAVGGVMRNSFNNAPEVGTLATQQLTPEARAAAYADAITPRVFGAGLPVAPYQHFGFATPEDYVNAQAAAAQSGSPISSAGAASSSATPAPTAPAATARAATPATTVPARSTTPAPQGVSPYMERALSDPEFKLPSLPTPTDQVSLEGAQKQQAVNIANKNELLSGAGKLANASATALQYLQAAQAALSGKPLTGTYGELWNKAIRAVHPGSGTLSSNDYLEASKWLVNAGAQQAQATFPGATEKEMGIALDFANPSVHMEAPALNSMILANERIARYGLLTANNAATAANGGVNPQDFPQWNQKWFPRDKLVNATAIRVNPTTHERWYQIDGQWTK